MEEAKVFQPGLLGDGAGCDSRTEQGVRRLRLQLRLPVSIATSHLPSVGPSSYVVAPSRDHLSLPLLREKAVTVSLTGGRWSVGEIVGEDGEGNTTSPSHLCPPLEIDPAEGIPVHCRPMD